jgi:threonine/homoserine efflux transporter RhtA
MAVTELGVTRIDARRPGRLSAPLIMLVSSVLTYGLDQFVLRIVGRARFALLLSLLPVAAVLVGLVGVAQVPSAKEFVGIGLVVFAIAVRDDSS